jgi:hypothetical protein
VDETSEHRQLAAVGVTFLFLVALNKAIKESVQSPIPNRLPEPPVRTDTSQSTSIFDHP